MKKDSRILGPVAASTVALGALAAPSALAQPPRDDHSLSHQTSLSTRHGKAGKGLGEELGPEVMQKVIDHPATPWVLGVGGIGSAAVMAAKRRRTPRELADENERAQGEEWRRDRTNRNVEKSQGHDGGGPKR